MALNNLENRVKQDSAYPRTAEDAVRRDKDIDKVTIKASQIELEGYTTINNGFTIDNDGNMACRQANIYDAIIEKEEGDYRIRLVDGGMQTSKKSTDSLSAMVKPQDIGLYKKVPVTGGAIYKPFVLMTNYGTDSSCYGWIQLSKQTGDDIDYPPTITLNGNTGDINTNGLINSHNGICQGSREELKKNFEKLENALDIVKDTDIYKYNLKDEKETDKKHIGFVIGENFNYRKEITSQSNEEADLYSMISVLWKAVQEQQEEIEELKKKVIK